MRRVISAKVIGIAFAATTGACGAKVRIELDAGGGSSIEASGGMDAVATGGAASTGGAAMLMSGGARAMGAIGGALTVGAGGSRPIIATGGAIAVGAAGGTGAIGAIGGAHTAGAGGTSSVVSSWGVGGLPLSGYCAGSNTKLQYQGRELSPQVTYYQPNAVLNCCDVYGLDLQTTLDLGFDLHLEIRVPLSGIPASYNVCYTNNSACPQANLNSTNDPTAAAPTVGTIRLDSDPTGAQTYAFGVCVQVDDNSSNLLGTKVFIPSPTGGQYY